jgi:peptide chain release factor 1
MRRSASGTDFDLDLLEVSAGLVVFRVSGKGARRTFANEAGGHRFQRVPPTERKGRVHTSTVTVAVLREDAVSSFAFDVDDVEIKTCRGSGKGGQHRNKTDTAVQATHRPSGESVRVEHGRSQLLNKEEAIAVLRARLNDRHRSSQRAARAEDRKGQVGSGERGDKRRTIALQRDSVVDHVLGVETTAKKYLRGEFDALWNRRDE